MKNKKIKTELAYIPSSQLALKTLSGAEVFWKGKTNSKIAVIDICYSSSTIRIPDTDL